MRGAGYFQVVEPLFSSEELLVAAVPVMGEENLRLTLTELDTERLSSRARAALAEHHGLADDMLRVEELEAALPSMTQWRVTAGRSVDWGALEADLGTALPSDFRSLAEAYPVLVIDDFLMLSVPTPGGEASWASESREDEILQDLYEMGDTEGYVPFPQPGGLISWAESNSGDSFYWGTSPGDPDAWPVVVRGDNGDWSEFPVGAVEFLTGVYRRTIHVPGMPGDFPSDSPEVLGLGDRID
ncbi:SMI1/KNR4 family protein [Streptomyces scopuliridis]|uniref:SMI1/KNR4 family protein n=1 Tax=Streptomyces scopuliridis TaxID=452529 RepID=UPI0036C18E93